VEPRGRARLLLALIAVDVQSQAALGQSPGSEPAVAPILTLDPHDALTAPDLRDAAARTLESGGVVVLPGRGFVLTAEERDRIADTRAMLTGIDAEAIRDGKPTIIYEPWRGRIKRRRDRREGSSARTTLTSEARSELEIMMARFGAWASALVGELFPSYASRLAVDRITYRPHERSALQPLHIDSSYGYPTNGRGMFRLFSNIDPSGRPRVWQVGEPFERFARRYVGSVAIRDAYGLRGILSRLVSARRRRSAYDDVIAELRLLGKRDQDYQRAAPRTLVEFPSQSCWFAITDLVLHGAISGRHSLDQTFFLPPTAMANPWQSSLYLLERMLGRALV
jgi:hypothetical protein